MLYIYRTKAPPHALVADPSWLHSCKRLLMMKKEVLKLRPTQFSVGMLEVDEKIREVSGYSKKERKAFVRKTLVPVVRGWGGELYVVDHHHFLVVCYCVGIKKVRIQVVKSLAKKELSHRQFWDRMRKSRHCYPYCQFGEGPRDELYLPKDIRGLADDPYRSLAWFVRKAGAFENSEKNFAEFAWANFFRNKQLLKREGMAGFEKALLKALKLAQSPEARRLPGYGKLNLAERAEAEKKLRKKKIAGGRKTPTG